MKICDDLKLFFLIVFKVLKQGCPLTDVNQKFAPFTLKTSFSMTNFANLPIETAFFSKPLSDNRFIGRSCFETKRFFLFLLTDCPEEARLHVKLRCCMKNT